MGALPPRWAWLLRAPPSRPQPRPALWGKMLAERPPQFPGSPSRLLKAAWKSGETEGKEKEGPGLGPGPLAVTAGSDPA